MKYQSIAILGCLLVLGSTNGSAEEKLRVLDQGLDGNQRLYRVTCPDGSLTSVVQTFDLASQQDEEKPPAPDVFTGVDRTASVPRVTRVCVQTGDGDDICRSIWNIDDAARTGCQ
jgi:hypothetical protein